MEIIKKIYKQSAFILVPAAALSALVDWKKLPVSILIGGVIALTNLKGLVWGIEGSIGTQKAATKLVFFSLLRLSIVFTILVILVLLRLINIIGVIIGFTAVFILFLKEGFKSAKEE